MHQFASICDKTSTISVWLLLVAIWSGVRPFDVGVLSEYVVGSSGIQFFTRLDSGEQWHVKSFCKSPKSFLKYLDHFFQVMLTPGIEYVMNYLGMMSSFVVGLIWIYYCF